MYLNGRSEDIHQIKKCAANCCGDEGVLIKKFEHEETINFKGKVI